MHDYLSVARNVRYALESMEDVLPRRVMKVSAGLRKIQDEFGMLGDVNAHVHKLHAMALDGPDAEIGYACGVCGGIMLILQENACKKAVAAWKDYKDDFITLEGLL